MNQNHNITIMRQYLKQADAILIGAGAGLSTAAGFAYSGERFQKYFGDLEKIYGYHDLYSGGFYPYPLPEMQWAAWSRNIYINRYMDAPKPVYENLLALVDGKEYFVITTNVDHCFQKAGIDKKRLFYTQGDYGLFQCSEPCHDKTYDNEATIRDMVLSQGFTIDANGSLLIPSDTELETTIQTELLPHCPICGKPMALNLRSDNTFVQDEGWYLAAEHYEQFLNTNLRKKIVFLEIGVGFNSPGVIKYPFWRYTAENKNAFYICINDGQTMIPKEISGRSICIDGDASEIIQYARAYPNKV